MTKNIYVNSWALTVSIAVCADVLFIMADEESQQDLRHRELWWKISLDVVSDAVQQSTLPQPQRSLILNSLSLCTSSHIVMCIVYIL